MTQLLRSRKSVLVPTSILYSLFFWEDVGANDTPEFTYILLFSTVLVGSLSLLFLFFRYIVGGGVGGGIFSTFWLWRQRYNTEWFVMAILHSCSEIMGMMSTGEYYQILFVLLVCSFVAVCCVCFEFSFVFVTFLLGLGGRELC